MLEVAGKGPVTFARLALNTGGLLVKAHDGADVLVQRLIGEETVSPSRKSARCARCGEGGMRAAVAAASRRRRKRPGRRVKRPRPQHGSDGLRCSDSHADMQIAGAVDHSVRYLGAGQQGCP